MNIFIFLSIALLITLIFGKIIEKARIPWVFAALFLGLGLSLYNPFGTITSSDTFTFLSDLGMYFLLFIIGMELDIKEMRKQGGFIAGLSLSLVLTESILGAIFIHGFFDISWNIAVLTATSFATVGEAILIPILDEFKITKTKFGQTILGVGTIDDIVELVTIIVASIVLGQNSAGGGMSFSIDFLFLGLLFLVPFLLNLFRDKIHHFKFKAIPPLFLFGLIVLFAFIGVGSFVESAALGAIFAGISLKNLLSNKKIEQFESIVRTIAYGLFVPIFFLHVGVEVDMRYLFGAPLMILLLLIITDATKIGTSLLLARKKLGIKKATLLGIGLSAKFSTSIVIIMLLYGKGLISSELYSVLIGSMIASKFIIPVSFSILLKKRKLKFISIENKKNVNKNKKNRK